MKVGRLKVLHKIALPVINWKISISTSSFVDHNVCFVASVDDKRGPSHFSEGF